MIKIGIVTTERAFLPEIIAYKKYFQRYSDITIETYSNIETADENCNVILYFCGYLPFWKKPKAYLINEYHSASAGRRPRITNLLKRLINARGRHYIFLNKEVRRTLFFPKKIPHSIRGMGYDSEFVSKYFTTEKKFDFVYCGSFRRRFDTVGMIQRIASLGFTVAVVGNSQEIANSFTDLTNITLFGRVELEKAYKIIAQSSYGLNYTPPVYPFYFQDSTKLIEYCAFGLKVVTNRYQWVDEFEDDIGARFLDIESIKCRSDVINFQFDIGNVKNFEWNSVILNSGLEQAIRRLFS